MTRTETTPFPANPQRLSMEIKRQHSYTTLARLIGAADSNPGSPVTPSPCGAVQLKRAVERLEEIDAESRSLLQTLFSMLEKDDRLERYVRRRLEDPNKVGRMWELVEPIMSTHRRHVDVDAILNNNKLIDVDDDGNNMWVGGMLRELKIEGHGDEMRSDRFKVRTFDQVADSIAEADEK